ncbi:MAG: DMT family transporter [Planctomycetota bacterium]|nr:DMT family transporter [Planctomycetota bacterium]
MTADRPSRLAGIFTIVLTLACWTSIPLFLKHFAGLIDGWTANGWRYGLSALIWLPALLLAWRKGSTPDALWRRALWPSVFNTLAQVCFGLAPYYTSPALMTFSLRLQIVFVTFGAALLFVAERRIVRSGGFLTGIGMVIAGTAATLLLNPEGLGGGSALGVGLSIGAGLLYACYSLSVRKLLQGVDPILAFAAISQYTAAAMVGLMLAFGAQHGAGALDLGLAQFGLLILSAIIGIGLGHTLYFKSIGTLGVAVSAGVVQLQPVFVSIVSTIFGWDRLTGAQWAAGGVAIAGAVVMLIAQHRLGPHTPAPSSTSTADPEFATLPVDEDVAAAENR